MRGKSLQRDREPALAHRRPHQSDIHRLIFKDRSLFDVQFIAGVDRESAGRELTAIADGIQRVTHRNTIPVGPGVGIGLAELPGPDAGGEHCRGKTRPFFVGPVHQHDVALGFNLMVVQGTQQFQPGQYAVNPVVIATQWLGIHMRTGHHRCQGGIFSGTADKHVAHAVHLAGKPRLQRPVTQQVAGDPIFIA